jgi:hypothetical protein
MPLASEAGFYSSYFQASIRLLLYFISGIGGGVWSWGGFFLMKAAGSACVVLSSVAVTMHNTVSRAWTDLGCNQGGATVVSSARLCNL